MKRRLLSLLMCLCMALTLLPRLAWAAEREETPLGEEAVAAPVAEKAPAAPVRAQTMDVGDPVEPDPDIEAWLQNRTLKVCGVTVTPENAHDILAGTSYSNGAEPAQLALYVQGDTKRLVLRLKDLNVDDSEQDTKLDHVIEYIGTGAPDDVLYVEIWNLLSEKSTFVSSAGNAVDISVDDGSLDLSGFNGDATNTLDLLGRIGPTNLRVRDGDLHIHDITLTADGWGDDGIYVVNGRLTVSGEDTVVTTKAGSGRRGSMPIDELKSQTELTLDDIFILEDSLAITSPAGAKAVLTVQEPNPEYGINYYSHTVAFTDEDGNPFTGADVVISKPHAHNGVTFDHTLASAVEDSDPETTFRYLLLDGEPWMDFGAQTIEDLVKNDLPAGSYLLTDNIDFDKGLEIKAGAVNLCLNGKKLNVGDDVLARSGQPLIVTDCSANQTGSIENEGPACSVIKNRDTDTMSELILESGTIKNTMTKEEGVADEFSNLNHAIYNGGYVTLRGGTVSGPYGVHLQYNFNFLDDPWNGTEMYAKSPIILAGAPKLDCSIADIHLILDLYDVNRVTHPMIDATGYTGTEPITIDVENYDASLSDKLGTPIVRLGAAPADKFTLINEGYCLEKNTVNGETCLVLAEAPAHFHPVCGAACAHEGADVHANMGFTKALTGDAEGGLYIDGEALSTETEYDSTFYTIPSGSYYLAGDVEIDTPIRIGTSQNTGGQAVALCFNGHTIHYTENKFTGNFITVYAPFTTCDCQEGQTGGVSGDPTNSTYSLLSVCAPTTLYGGAFTREEYGYGINMRYVNAGVTVDGATIKTKGVAINGEGPSVGVTIKSGRVESTAGTAVVLNKSPRFTMEGGTLIGKMQGANIECTEVSDGVTGCGTISGGTIQSELYGLFLYVDKPLTLTGAPVIKGGESFGDIVFSPNRSNMLNVGDLGDQVYTVTCWAGTGFITENNPYAISVAASTDQSGHFKTLSNDTAHSIRDAVDSDGNHTVQIYKAHTHAMSVDCSTTEGNQVTFTAWDSADSLPTTAGNYVLTGDVVLPNTAWTVPEGTVNLCLGGHTVMRNGGNSTAIYVPTGATLSICDCATGGVLAHSTSQPVISVGGELHLYSGTIAGKGYNQNYATEYGVEVRGGTFQMHGGSITGITTNTGCGVNVEKNGTFLMDGGTITGNRLGVLVDAEGAFRAEGNVVIDSNGTDANPHRNVVMYSKHAYTQGPDDLVKTVIPVPMELSGPLGASAKLGLSLYSWRNMEEVSPYLALQGAGGYAVTADDFAKLSSDKASEYPLKFTNGKVYFTVPQTHSHTWATAWSSDANGHWHACTAEGCDITDYANCGETGAAYGTHVYTNDQDITCNTCGYTRSVALYGTVSITGTAKIGGTLTASVSGAPSGVTLTYQWTVEGGDGTVLGAAAAYTPGAAAVVGKNLVCTVTTDDAHYTGSIRATTGAVALGDRTAPTGLFTVTDIPVGGTTGSIAVSADADKLEYRKVTDPATETWTAVTASGDTATLSQLTGGSYEFRYKETATHNASPATTVQVWVLTSQAKALTIASGIEHGTVTKQRDMVNPGDTVTLAVQPDEGYELETITVRYTEGGVERTITPTVKADNPSQYTFTMPDADVTITATFTSVTTPDQGDVKGEVEVKGDAPAVAVDEETLKDLAGEIQDGDTVTVKLTVEKLDSPTDKDELEAIISGKKDDVLYLGLSLLKQVNDAAPQPITDTKDKVLEIAVDYDFTGKKDVTVYRKHGENDAEKLTKLTARPAGDFQDGTFYADGVGKVYIYASKFSTYAIGYTEETTSPVTPPSRPSSRPSRRPTQAEEPTWPFADVTEQDWHYEGVKYVYEKGLMEGASDTTFAPGMDTSRAMIATILWRLSGSPEPEAGLTYPDCKAGSWYAKAVAWGTEAGILKGYDTGDFGPNDPITREQMALMLWRYAGSPKTSADLDKFVDGKSVSDWVYPAMEWAVEQGILTGKGGDVLAPQGHATRAEAAAVLQRFCERKK